MATKGIPKGPEIPDKSQVKEGEGRGGQPGLQHGMQAQPISDRLPTQHGDQDVLTLETYRGVGKFQGKVAIVTGGDSGIGRSVALLLCSITAPLCLHLMKLVTTHLQVAIVTSGDSGIGRSVALLFCSITAPLCLHLMKLVAALQSQVAIVTGGDSGIGRSVSLLLAKEGAKAVAIVHTPKEQKDADDAKKLIEKEGSEALSIPCDLAEGEETCKRIVDQALCDELQESLLTIAGGWQYIVPSIEETTTEILEDTYRTNIFPMFYLTKYAVPHMARGSSIVSSTSVTAYQGSKSLLEYSSTKGAIIAFTRSLSQQLAPKGIRVNAVAAGPIWTPLNPASREDENLEGFKGKDAPLGRIGQPIEAATSYLFLASQASGYTRLADLGVLMAASWEAIEASYMTGQVLHPNGGFVVNG
ncbi:hypothetical protein COHA_005677 [Chlorella ohadii]|uniref:Uncharacterized protein n=1 Tax=Chlorella ohadii TaxID=2649997 RepID=A0AAD5DPE1_9CHLO|nr:hypothetical protein COHA_005677 [Chlorella ohadii]